MLDYWKLKEMKWPHLAKMAKQYFAAPASSAGVVRVFSAAGKMHAMTCARRRPTPPSSTRFMRHITQSNHLNVLAVWAWMVLSVSHLRGLLCVGPTAHRLGT